MKKNGRKGHTIMEDHEIKEAHKMLKKGSSQQEVCRIMGGIHVNTLKSGLLLNGIKIDPSWKKDKFKLTEKQIALVKRLFKNGITIKDISERLGMSSIHKLLCKMEISNIDRPETDFQVTEDIKFIVLEWILSDESISIIAEKLETKESFIKLIIAGMGSRRLFDKNYSHKNNRGGLNNEKIERFIELKLKGGSTPDIIVELGVSRPTIDATIKKIIMDFVIDIRS